MKRSKKRFSMLATAATIGAAVVACFSPAAAHAAELVTHGRTLLYHADVLGAHGSAVAGAGLAAIGIGSTTGFGNHAATSKWFRVAVEGATTDGRTIERDWITQMAATYDRTVYSARVNCEHIRGYAPMSATNPFGAYGDVIALKSEEIKDGGLKGKMGLYAQIQPTQALIDMTKADQKIYTSIEVAPSFADTKQAYLIGLAVTDSPASLGTEILQFAAGQGDKNPFASKKQHRDNLFTAAEATVIEFETPAPSIFSRVAELLGIVKNKGDADDKRYTDLTQAVEALATHGQQQAATVTKLTGDLDSLKVALSSEKEAHARTATALAELTEQLLAQPNGAPRPPATGGTGATKTDC
ncbi:phage capsid protein [Burkholderia ubonensis]|nr:phage capsid protein [Burkholderia ubonensis]PAJ97710.1 phage capsid protein [Burkholderia ubonensis]PAK08145.1 phage capsid protein [Burkholderia ubonensis]RQP80354.1 phage capsid protein [Burkholderia ubonensis]RQP99588.1 phage capsid protein [Burkholderia ubonensis]